MKNTFSNVPKILELHLRILRHSVNSAWLSKIPYLFTNYKFFKNIHISEINSTTCFFILIWAHLTSIPSLSCSKGQNPQFFRLLWKLIRQIYLILENVCNFSSEKKYPTSSYHYGPEGQVSTLSMTQNRANVALLLRQPS